MSKRIAIFAHWDRDNLIDDYVVYYLTELQKIADIIFVSDCDLSQNELDKISSLVIRSQAHRHGEYDFGSYKRGVLSAEDKLHEYDELIFVNDSCYGPFFPFKDLWKAMEARPCDYWGLFKHLDPIVKVWHVQSYFLVFKKQVFSSPVFINFVKKVGPENGKRDLVLKYEVEMSKCLDEAGFQSDALCPPSTENETHKNKVYELVAQHQFPLLKVAFLSKNPFFEPLVYRTVCGLRKLLKDNDPYTRIENHLNRTAPENYQDLWFQPNLINIEILHRRFIKIKEKEGKYFCFLRIKFFGISLPRIPSKILFHRWIYERKSRNS